MDFFMVDYTVITMTTDFFMVDCTVITVTTDFFREGFTITTVTADSFMVSCNVLEKLRISYHFQMLYIKQN